MKLFWQLFWIFFKIGAFTLGSGYAMMPQIRRELVTRMKWLDEDEFIDIAVAFQGIQDDPVFVAAFKAVKPASVALILVPVLTIAERAGITGKKFLLPLTAAGLIAFTSMSPIYVVVASIAGGIIYYGRKTA